MMPFLLVKYRSVNRKEATGVEGQTMLTKEDKTAAKIGITMLFIAFAAIFTLAFLCANTDDGPAAHPSDWNRRK